MWGCFFAASSDAWELFGRSRRTTKGWMDWALELHRFNGRGSVVLLDASDEFLFFPRLRGSRPTNLVVVSTVTDLSTPPLPATGTTKTSSVPKQQTHPSSPPTASKRSVS